MANGLEDKTSLEQKSWIEKVALVVPLIGILSFILAVVTFIGFKPEKGKLIEWEYRSKESVVNASAASSDKIEVAYDGRKIKQLSVISARLANLGGLPVDSSDVKDGSFPTVTFTNGARVIWAQIKSRVPPELKASLSYSTNSVRLEHGLLNPSDAIEFQILLDGDPGDAANLPHMTHRIAGITTPVTRFPSTASRRFTVVFFQVPVVTQYVVLALASILPLASVTLFVIALGSCITSLFPERELRTKLEAIIASPECSAVPTAEMPTFLARKLYVKLGSPLDARARDLVKDLTLLENETRKAYFARVRQRLLAEVVSPGTFARVLSLDRGALSAAIVFGVVGACGSMVMAGCWCIALAHM